MDAQSSTISGTHAVPPIHGEVELQPVNERFEPTDTAVIRRWLNSPGLGAAFRDPDFDAPEVSDDVVDMLLSMYLDLDRLGASAAQVRTALGGWAATVADKLPPNRAADGTAESVAYGMAVFSILVHAGQIHGCPMEWLLWFSAALATMVVKRCFRLQRCPPMGSDRTYVEAFLAARSGILSEPPRSTLDAEVVSCHDRRAGAGESGKSENVYKLPLETEDFQGGTTNLPYAAFKKNVQTAIKFYAITSERDALLYLFRHLSKDLRWELVSLAGVDNPPLATVWRLLDDKFGHGDTPGTVASRWEAFAQGEGESVSDLYTRLLRERSLYSEVTGTQLPPTVVAAKFVSALAPGVRDSLETAWGRALGDFTVEQVREHALFYEGKQSSEVTAGTDKAAKYRKNNNSYPNNRPAATGTALAAASGNGQPRNPPNQMSQAPSGQRIAGATNVRCKYCADRGYKKADKHSDASCWENPANASKRPPWFKPLEGRLPKGSGPASSAIVEAGKTFMTCTTGGHGLVGIEALLEHSLSSKQLPALLLLDTGSEYTLASSQLVGALGVEIVSYESPMVLAAAGEGGSITVTGEVTLPVLVYGDNGKWYRFHLVVHVAVDLNPMVAEASSILLGLNAMRKMGAQIAVGDSSVFLKALDVTVELRPWGAPSSLATAPHPTPVDGPACVDSTPLPSKEEISRRLHGWRFPRVEVELKPGVVRPCPRRPYACGTLEMAAMEMIVENLEKANVVRRISRAEIDDSEAWVNPAFLVPKSTSGDPDDLTPENVEKKYRLVIDARGINECVADLLSVWRTYQTTPSQCIAEIPSGSIFFGSVDIRSAYYNLRYAEDSRKYFAFSYYAADGSVAYAIHEKMVMGFKGSSFHWGYAAHTLMAKALPEVYRSDGASQIIVYVDDILVWARDQARCAEIMGLITYIFETVGAEVPEDKQKGPTTELDFIGLHLQQDGFSVAESTLNELRQALQDPPTTLRGLRTKLGLCQFCRALWNAKPAAAEESLSHLIAPFTTIIGKMTTEKSRKGAKIPWNDELQHAWIRLQQSMGNGFTYYHSFDHEPEGLQFVITADASPAAGAAVLWRINRDVFLKHQDEISASWLADNGHLIGFFTHRWNAAEQNYDIACKELHIICHGLAYWKQLLLTYIMRNPRDSDDSLVGRVVVLSDSSSALGKLAARADMTRYQPDARQVKRWLGWLSLVMEFDQAELVFSHIPGRLNGFSDLLSRLVDNGRRYLPEGGGNPVVLVTVSAPAQSAAHTEQVQEQLARILCDSGVGSEMSELQKADQETRIHGASLAEYHQHFGNEADLPRGAAEAVQLGLISCIEGLVMTVADVNDGGEVLVPIIPVGVIPGLQAIISTNVDTNWSVREWLLFCVHELGGHGGYHHLRMKLVSRAWWPSLLQQAQRWVQSCDYCMQQKAHNRLKLMSAPRVARGLIDLSLRGKYIALDHGYPASSPIWIPAVDPKAKAFLVITCVATGFTVVRAVSDVTGETTTRTLFGYWVPYMGIPRGVMGDNFMDTPSLRKSLAACGVRFLPTPPWAPWANGSAEGRVGRVKRLVPSIRIPWDQALPQVQLLMNTHKRSSGFSSSELMYGTTIRSPSDAVLDAVFEPSRTPTDELLVLAESSEVPVELQKVLSHSVGRARLATLYSHIRDDVRALAHRTGRLPVDGELVVWRRPGAQPIEGRIRLVSGVNVADGPFTYLGKLSGHTTRMVPLGAGEDFSISVSPAHLEPRTQAVDWNRPAVATEITIPSSAVAPGDMLLVRLVDGGDVIGKVIANGTTQPDETDFLVHVYDSPDGTSFWPVWISRDGETYASEAPIADDVPLQRMATSGLRHISLTNTGRLREATRQDLLQAGYLSG